MKALNAGALLLMIVGALNWGLWGVLQFDLVAALLGGTTAPLSRAVYTLVGLAGVYGLTLLAPLFAPSRAPETARSAG